MLFPDTSRRGRLTTRYTAWRNVAAGALFGLVMVIETSCTTASLEDLGTPSTILVPAMAKEMAIKGVRQEDPVLVRIFKEESELEIWKKRSSGEYAFLKTYPICRWSGKLGPKTKDGDRQAPEGFYHVSAGMLNPQSQYFRSFNLGYPNRLERALGYHGEALMVHGACSSSGCFAMTDQGVGEIYAIAKLALDSGQKQFQVQAYPFRMTPENLSAHRNDPNMPFWLNLYEGYRYFERTKREPTVAACGGKYVFNRNFQDGDPKDVLGACPAEKPTTPGQAITPKIAREHPLVGEVPLHANAYADGGMNESFRVLLKKFGPDKLAGRISTSRYPISRPTAALSDPFESE